MGFYEELARQGREAKAQREDESDRGRLAAHAEAAGQFADHNQQRFAQRGYQQDQAFNRMRDIAEGRQSYSGEQLRQGLAQNMAQQQAMAAGARGGNQVMAARQASMNAARAGSGLAGQQALAGIAERNSASQALMQGLGQARGQDLQAGMGSRGQAIQGYGMGLANPEEDRFGQLLGGGVSLGTAALMSDKRQKTNISEGDQDAHEFAKALKAYSYDYTNDKNGRGRQLGVMAQDVEATKFGEQIVSNGPNGEKMLDAAKLAGALAATTAHLNKRVESLENGK